ncbi:MAG: M48 family metallopeptidase [Defluviitaleaceae bacterium]|nr:M48 family metallopeptidase [Defluviitaleaceae bacterium]
MKYAIKRSKRKTMALHVRDGLVEVRAPLWVRNHEIEKFVADHEQWVNDKLEKSKLQQLKRDRFAFNYGVTLLYRGNEYPIVAREGNRIGFDIDHFYMPFGLASNEIKEACIQIYKMLAKDYMPRRVITLSKAMGLAPAAIKINSAKTRWGSCSSKKSINFSWRLIMADDEAIDYVIIHELAHLIEMNHSARFWAIVEKILPDYRKHKTHLKALQRRLAEEDWD